MAFVLTMYEVLQKGLELTGFDLYRQQSVSRGTSNKTGALQGAFRVWSVCICADLGRPANDSWWRQWLSKVDFNYFLVSVHFLWRYPTEQEQIGVFKICDKSARSWSWFYARKVQALKEQKVSYERLAPAVITKYFSHFLYCGIHHVTLPPGSVT